MGPSKPAFPEGSPPIPSGPRAQRTGPSSKQWINPALKNRVPESPKSNRSQGLAQPQSSGFRSESTQPERQVDFDRRPRSSDAKADIQIPITGSFRDLHPADSSQESGKTDCRPQSAGSSWEKNQKLSVVTDPVKVENTAENPNKEAADVHQPADEDPLDKDVTMTTEDEVKLKSQQVHTINVPIIRVSLPRKQQKRALLDQSSESDDDEEFGEEIESEMRELEAKLKRLEGIQDSVPLDAIKRHAIISLEAATRILREPEGLQNMVGPIPHHQDNSEGGKVSPETQPQQTPKDEDKTQKAEEEANLSQKVLPTVPEPVVASSATSAVAPAAPSADAQDNKAEETPSITPSADEIKPKIDDGDVVMEDAPVAGQSEPATLPPVAQPNGTSTSQKQSPSPGEEAQPPKRGSRSDSSPPSAEDDDETEIEDFDLQSIDIVRTHGPTPPIESLPYFGEKPWYEDSGFIKSMDAPQLDLNNFILNKLRNEAQALLGQQTQSKKIYAGNYEGYLRFTMSDDPLAVKSREKFSPSTIETSGQKPGFSVEPKPESTRRSRYASERDLERILEESRRVEDEKRERQLRAEKEKYRTEKEAMLPDQYQTLQERENEFYTDVAGFVEAEKIVAAWELLPPVDNFTEEETAIFEKAYLEFPKQWGRVSEPLAHRDFGTSIQFYYLKKEKEELNLKEKLKKRPRQRKKGRGKQRSSALVSELGNGDNENEEMQETGENNESRGRRPPRRAAAPTFNSEATPATDGEGGTPTGTPGRRGGAKAEGSSEKPERKRRGRQAAKDKEPKQPRATPTLAAAPPTAAKGNRSRSSSRAHGPDWVAQQQQSNEVPRLATHPELAPSGVSIAPTTMQTSFPQVQPLLSPERGIASALQGSLLDMAPPPLRPDPLQQPPVTMLDLNPTEGPDRKSGTQPSSYWSVPEATEFPLLLRSFGSDWGAIASHMRTKTAVMVGGFSRSSHVNSFLLG